MAWKRVIIHNGKIPQCPECGDDLPCKDIGLEDKNGDAWALVEICDSGTCRDEILRPRTKTFVFMGDKT